MCIRLWVGRNRKKIDLKSEIIMGMDYYIEPKSENEYEDYLDFPNTLSYFFEQFGGYDEKSIVSQIESILNIDLSIFQKVYNPEMEFDFEEYDHDENDHNPDDFWVNTDDLIKKLEEFKEKIQSNTKYFSQIIFNPDDDDSKMSKMDIEDIIRYQKENPLTAYPRNNGILTEESLSSSISELIDTLKNLRSQNIEQVRLNYM
ncbi:hypothetical protein HHL23_03940 [Chryseobacterium sp. RP-3-3]|uniref:Uncharacterized protein n=1 Tax=Chryseobacterium antibioticum TaxID=2728847 RepID=A0A7Y0AKB8_9FLAO|nr:hypothetical protein [Chryseobacterium antibioticum]NML68946.1 hypothetical protein [Chryseobacterium antibioticum]